MTLDFSEVNAANKTKRAFVFAFAFLLNSTTISQIDEYLYHIYVVFNSQRLDGVCLDSIVSLGSAIQGSTLDLKYILQVPSPEEKMRNDLFNELTKNSKINSDQALKKRSPFYIYYEARISEIQKKLPNRTDLQNFELNEFYCPPLFEILRKRLYLLPIWSGVIIHNSNIGYKCKTRLSNNPVENWFGQLKRNILKNDIVILFNGL